MRLLTKFTIATLAIGIVGFLFGPAAPLGSFLWGDMPEGPEPEGIQVPLLILYSAISAFSMGFGISFWLFAAAWTRRLFPAWTVAAHLAIGWIPASFWVHDSLHMMNGESMAGLVALEYGFHVPTLAAGVVLAVATIKGVEIKAAQRRPAYTTA